MQNISQLNLFKDFQIKSTYSHIWIEQKNDLQDFKFHINWQITKAQI